VLYEWGRNGKEEKMGCVCGYGNIEKTEKKNGREKETASSGSWPRAGGEGDEGCNEGSGGEGEYGTKTTERKTCYVYMGTGSNRAKRTGRTAMGAHPKRVNEKQ